MRQNPTSAGIAPGWTEDVQRVRGCAEDAGDVQKVWRCAEDTEDAASQGRVRCLPPLQVPSFTLSLG